MKKQHLVRKINSLTLLAFCFLLVSCSKKEICHQLSEDDLAFLTYDTGEQFKLRNEMTQDTVIFEVVSKVFEKQREKHNFSTKNHYVQKGTVEFTGNSNCNGFIEVTSSIDNKYTLLFISLADCLSLTSFSEYHSFGTIQVNGKDYENTYLFTSHLHKLYFSKEEGFLKIDEISTGNTLYTIVE